MRNITIHKIRKVVREEVESILKEKEYATKPELKKELSIFKSEIKSELKSEFNKFEKKIQRQERYFATKKDIADIKATLNIIIEYFEKGTIQLTKRVDRIETHLELPSL